MKVSSSEYLFSLLAAF